MNIKFENNELRDLNKFNFNVQFNEIIFNR